LSETLSKVEGKTREVEQQIAGRRADLLKMGKENSAL